MPGRSKRSYWCVHCSRLFWCKRLDAQTCSAKCRQAERRLRLRVEREFMDWKAREQAIRIARQAAQRSPLPD